MVGMTDEPFPVLAAKYEISCRLGEGGMGTVYRGIHRGMEREVAFKVLKGSLSNTPEHQLRFRKEAQLISALKHPNIVSIFAMDITEDGLPYIVMEYLDGRPLSDLIKEKGSLGYRQALPLFIQVCAALEHAHSRGIVHRDLKPSNLVVTQNTDGAQLVKVVDFGIAKALQGESVTQTNVVLGSAFYLSPGQCAGRAADTRSDIYSLGCTLFEALSGRPPFVGDSFYETIQLIDSQPTPRVSDFNPATDAPEALQQVIERCLQKDADDRYASIADLRRDLENVLDNKPVSRVPVSHTPARAGRNRVNGRIKLAAIMGGAALLGALLIAFRTYTEPQEEKFVDVEGERAGIRALISRGHDLLITSDHKTALPPLEEANRRAKEIADPMLEGASAAEMRVALIPDNDDIPEEQRDQLDAKAAQALRDAIHHIEAAKKSGLLKDKTLIANQLVKCREGLLWVCRDPSETIREGKQALENYEDSDHSGDLYGSLVTILNSLVQHSLDVGNQREAILYAKQRRDFIVSQHVDEAEFATELQRNIENAKSRKETEAVEQLTRLLPPRK